MGGFMDEVLKRGPGRPPKHESKQVRLLRSYKPADGVKQAPGDVLDLPIEEARNVVRLGIAERADAF